jgi:K(+)-stimulated pyrophosphate-energized sodium pump
MDSTTLYIVIATVGVGILAFIVAYFLYRWVKKLPSDNETIEKVGGHIRRGANTFLKREYTVLAIFAGIVALLILLFLPEPIWVGGALENVLMAGFYLLGTLLSAIAGKVGIMVATTANVKTAEAAKRGGITQSFLAGFRGGSVMGLAVVATCVIGISAIYGLTTGVDSLNDFTASTMLGFSFGASSLALFAKAGGGIFTKTADISADLVGKVQYGIPEDDPRNPAVIADNVGDNVGDVAGMGADLFDSNVAAIAAALVIAINLDDPGVRNNFIQTILVFSGLGLLSTIIGILFARMGKHDNPSRALNIGTYVTTGLFAASSALCTWLLDFSWYVWGAAIVGLAVGTIIGIATDYYTNDVHKPVQQTAKLSEDGPAFTILSGVSYGFLSVLPAMIGIAIAAVASFMLVSGSVPAELLVGLTEAEIANLETTFGMFGISMAAVGMLSIVGIIVSNDAYGPIVDNARGLAEMGGFGEEIVEITDKLDSAGNTVKAVTKGFSIGAAGLTVVSLLGAFISEVNERIFNAGLGGYTNAFGHIVKPFEYFNITDPVVFFGIIIGAAVPAVFSALLMMGVNKNASRMVAEIHRQFNEIEGLLEGKPGVEAEYDKCIDIATVGSLKELIPSGLFAIITTILVGIIGGVSAIGGFLLGNIVSGLLLSLFMSNAGGLWDNAKKYVEAGNNGGVGSDAHKAAVIGDTVGDPFKDTAGPSINTQITVVSLVASICSGIFLSIGGLGLF